MCSFHTKKIKDIEFLLCDIWRECKDRKTVMIFLAVVAVMYSPTWGGYLLHAICGWKAGSVIASAYALFWAGPCTPFFPLCIAITLALKKRSEQKEHESGYRWYFFRRRLYFVIPLYRTK